MFTHNIRNWSQKGLAIALVSAVALMGLLFFVTNVRAGTGIGTTVTMPANVTVGDSNVAGSITFVNTSTAPDNVGTTTISSIQIKTTLANTGVFNIDTPSTGVVGSCGAGSFSFTPAGAGTWNISPDVVLDVPGVNGTCQIDFTFDVLAFPAADDNGALAGTQAFLNVNGSAVNNQTGTPGSAAGTGQTTVVKASPSISTTPVPASTTIGTILNDTATLSGGFSPAGTVTFKLFPPADTTCSGAASYTDPDATAPYDTSTSGGGFASNAAGVWHWTADYAGDANNNATSSPCSAEAVTVNKIGSQTVTQVHNPAHQDITGTSTPAATAVHDQATVTGGGPTPTGNVTFTLHNNPNCDGGVIDTEIVPLNLSGVAETSATSTLAAGSYGYLANYEGNGTYNASQGVCEPFTLAASPLIVEKTSRTAYVREWDWTIEKTAATSTLVLAEGESYTVNYAVNVSGTATTTLDASGTITITNPVGNPSATITGVTDVLSVEGAATVTCPAITFPHVLAAGASIVCTYQIVPGAPTDQTNTATVTTSGPVAGGSDTVDVDFGAPTDIDECVVVTDTYSEGPQGAVVCAGDGDNDETFNYAVTFGPQGGQGVDVPVVCGENNHPNTASYVTQDDINDTDEAGSDNWNVLVNVNCFVGCTLTQGYWKTHNDSFKGGAPTDDNWDLITPAAELSGFFTTANSYPVLGPNIAPFSWFSVFWTAPKGNAYYNLAHQYMAAKLNILNGASTTAAVDAAITAAEDFFDSYTPAAFSALGKKHVLRGQVIGWAGTLGSYNEGLIGPGHCDEQNPQ